ncbi:Asp-tRNA(Asn)/Glu-tRNA(Gln) amidotransferase subunit GatB, partial [Candidatus Roizmanbacteria bacterium]|nr:Asp-tRNA(Asn)/Glu-tRNA(Gln) amidotransferase subunit GatB [Candidatus Roizmanbacteria bacterium]
RSGVPLVEIVTEPDFQSSGEVKKFLEELQVLIRYLDVSDADMEKGSMRLEPNVSLRKFSTISNKTLPNYKVEVKNINSFRFVKQAIDYEVKRQSEILERGGNPVQETRGYDEEKGETYSQRTKEQAHDYRYFPEPDIPPLVFDRSYLEEIERNLPMLPHQLVEKFEKNYRIRHQDAYLLTRDRKTAEYYEKVMKETKLSGQAVANLLINKKISQEFSPDEFTRKALELLSPRETDSKVLEEAVKKVLKTNEKAVDDYKKGKPNAVMFLVGQVMREMKGKADARIVREKLIEKLT